MLTLLEQIDKGTLWRAIGGVHPPENKIQSNAGCITRLSPAQEYIIPLPQVGDSAKLVVAKGDYVKKGQTLTAAAGFGYLPVHAPTSGHIHLLEARPSNHASGLPVLSAVLHPDGQDLSEQSLPSREHSEVMALDNQRILTLVEQAGIAGLGGAAFPTHIKLNPVSDIELLIINGIECEPFITADDRLMREYADDILLGIELIDKLVNPQRIIIAIEDNKPEAIEAIEHGLNRSAIDANKIRITVVPTLYPSGGEKQLIQILTGQEVPSGAIPAQLGIVVQNVATAFAIKQAVYDHKPLTERVVTVTGKGIKRPGNYWVPIGTPIKHILNVCEFDANRVEQVIIGGPMMGYTLPDASAPVLKGSNCVLVPEPGELGQPRPELPCVRCGECAQACPAQLLPQQLFWHAKAKEYDKAASYNLQDCIECGCCSYVCPSDIPLVEYYRIAKSAIRTEVEEKKQAELAKQRFDSRTLRLEEEKAAREAKAKQAAERRKATMSSGDKDAVAEAMARIKAKKAQEQGNDNKKADVSAAIARAKAKKQLSTDNSSADSKSDQVAAAIARAKAKKAAANNQDATSASHNDDKKAKVAAAIERAKAKKAATQEPESISDDQVNDKKAKIAAVARARAKKAATQEPESNSDDQTDDKKAKISAAVARAKAKKAAAQEPESTSDNQADDKKAKIAAAVAKAKAKKTAAQEPEPTSDNQAVDKKAKIAAAVARAKAKKAAAQDIDSSNAVEDQTSVPESPRTVNSDAIESSNDKIDVEQDAASHHTQADDKKARIAAAVAKAKAKKAKAQHTSKEED
ncbi:electron transport complex subunit RsxC [Shewanella waksmanii]|uniref:electron transport complex subunit RsxC n=1 Tax=Shewanella waksmanii TaxID=213783 RepID=UPI00373539B8